MRTLGLLEQFEGSVRLSQLEQHGAVLLNLLDQGCALPLDPTCVPSMERKPGD